MVDESLRISLFEELTALLDNTHRFEQCADGHVCAGAYYLAKYRILLLDIFRRASAGARKYLFEDFRENGGLSFGEISFLVAIGHRAQPNAQASSVREKDGRFILAGIPKSLELPTVDFSNFRDSPSWSRRWRLDHSSGG